MIPSRATTPSASRRLLRFLAVLPLSGPVASARAQGVAEGGYPATLFCEAGPGAPALRVPLTVTITGGAARYSVAVPGGPETGTGTLSGRSLVLFGRSRRWEARYAGSVDGLGGLLTGRHTGPGVARACQLSLGSGR